MSNPLVADFHSRELSPALGTVLLLVLVAVASHLQDRRGIGPDHRGRILTAGNQARSPDPQASLLLQPVKARFSKRVGKRPGQILVVPAIAEDAVVAPVEGYSHTTVQCVLGRDSAAGNSEPGPAHVVIEGALRQPQLIAYLIEATIRVHLSYFFGGRCRL